MNYCSTCIHNPPSSCDGKPCTQCDPDSVYFNCYQKAVDDILSQPPKHYTHEEAKECLMSIGVMDENENLIPPYDKIFVKRGEE